MAPFIVAGRSDDLMLSMTFRAILSAMTSILQFLELGGMAVLAEIVRYVVFEARVHRLMAFKAFWVLVPTGDPLAVLAPMARVTSVGHDAVVPVAVRTVLPAVRSHVQLHGLVGVAVRTEVIGHVMLETSGVRVMAVDTLWISVVVLAPMAEVALHDYLELGYDRRIVASRAWPFRMLPSRQSLVYRVVAGRAILVARAKEVV